MFIAFVEIGLFTIGGGLASLPLLKELVIDGNWATAQQFMDMLAISQSTPGPIGINMATFCGYQKFGIPGAVVATVGMITPSFIIVCIIAIFIRDFNEKALVRRAMRGFRAVAVGLIAAAIIYILSKSILNEDNTGLSITNINAQAVIIFVISIITYHKFKLHPFIYVISGAVAGIFIF